VATYPMGGRSSDTVRNHRRCLQRHRIWARLIYDCPTRRRPRRKGTAESPTCALLCQRCPKNISILGADRPEATSSSTHLDRLSARDTRAPPINSEGITCGLKSIFTTKSGVSAKSTRMDSTSLQPPASSRYTGGMISSLPHLRSRAGPETISWGYARSCTLLRAKLQVPLARLGRKKSGNSRCDPR